MTVAPLPIVPLAIGLVAALLAIIAGSILTIKKKYYGIILILLGMIPIILFVFNDFFF